MSTLDEVEALLRAALDADDRDRIAELGARMDALEAATRVAHDLQGSAHWYADQGVPVFPLRPGHKQPATVTGCKAATLDHDQITTWWAATPDANIGLATGGRVVVIDIDGLPGHRSRLDHWDLFEQLTVFGKVCTPRPCGMHIYLPGPDAGGLEVRNAAAWLPGIDIRGAGGYVVAPPSHTVADDHQHAGTYTWLRSPNFTGHADQVHLTAAATLARVAVKARHHHAPVARRGVMSRGPSRGPGARVARFAAILDTLAEAQEGQRNAVLHWCACRSADMLADGEAPNAASLADALLGIAAEIGLEYGESVATIRSGFATRGIAW